MKNYDVFKGPNALQPEDQITMTVADLEKKYVSRQAWDALRKDLDGYKTLTDNLFDECLEALGMPGDFSLLEIPWQLRTMQEKINTLQSQLDRVYLLWNVPLDNPGEVINMVEAKREKWAAIQELASARKLIDADSDLIFSLKEELEYFHQRENHHEE